MTRIELPFKVKRPILACGADIKGAFAVADGRYASLFDGFGDLSDPANLARYTAAIGRSVRCFGSGPAVIACDMHPGYQSSMFARQLAGRCKAWRLCKVQHHHGHVSSAIIDSRAKGDIIGVAFDGTGYGTDGNIWGGEFFTGNARRLRRVAHLAYVPMPGGEAVVFETWRMAAVFLYRALGEGWIRSKIDFVKGLESKKWNTLKIMIDKKINSPLTSSAGRLFDAAASLILSKSRSLFEAELPIALERLAVPGIDGAYNSRIEENGKEFTVDASPMFKGMVRDLINKADTAIISTKFHNSIANIILTVCSRVRKASGLKRVLLTGGVFQNRFLTAGSIHLLRKNSFIVHAHSVVSANDNGIPIGQIAVAEVGGVCV